MATERTPLYVHAFSINLKWLWLALVPGLVLEILADLAGWRGILPQPFDLPSHAGNLWSGVSITHITVLLLSLVVMQSYKKEDFILEASRVIKS